jgi:hypothetical protein
MSLSRWLIATAGLVLVVGAAAWLTKVGIIIATDGRVTHTGAAGTSFTVGLVLLSVGAAGLGLRLAMSVDLVLRVILRAGFAFVLRFFSHRVRDRSWRARDRRRCAAPLHARRSGDLDLRGGMDGNRRGIAVRLRP